MTSPDLHRMPLSKRPTITIGGIIGIRIGTVAIIGIVGIIGAGLTTGITTITRTGVTTGTPTATIGEQPAQFVALRQYHKKNGLAGISVSPFVLKITHSPLIRFPGL